MTFLDDPVADFSRPGMHELLEIFIRAYDVEYEALALAGIVSTTPLLLFTGAARRLRYSTLGMLQFIAPTLQFLIAVLMYGEAFTTAHAVAFGAIWLALGLYVTGLTRDSRASVTIPE